MIAFPHLMPGWWARETVFLIALQADVEQHDGTLADLVLIVRKTGEMRWTRLETVTMETDWITQEEHQS